MTPLKLTILRQMFGSVVNLVSNQWTSNGWQINEKRPRVIHWSEDSLRWTPWAHVERQSVHNQDLWVAVVTTAVRTSGTLDHERRCHSM